MPAGEAEAGAPGPASDRPPYHPGPTDPGVDDLAERATKALAGIGYGLGDVSAATASQVTIALRPIRHAIGDLT